MVRHTRKRDLLFSTLTRNLASTLGYTTPLLIAPPGALPNLNFHYDASDTGSITTGVGDQVTQWDDQTANNNDATQGVGADQPLTNQTTLNGLNVLTFTINQHLVVPTSATVNPTEFDIFVVYRPTSITTIHGVLNAMGIFNDGGFSMTILSTAHLGFVSDGVGGTISQPIGFEKKPVANVARIYNMNNENTTPRVTQQINGFQDGFQEVDACAYPAARDMYINRFLGSAPGFGLIGDIGEIVGYGRKLTTVERVGTINFLKFKWGL